MGRICGFCKQTSEIIHKELFAKKVNDKKCVEEVFSVHCRACGNLKFGYSKQLDYQSDKGYVKVG